MKFRALLMYCRDKEKEIEAAIDRYFEERDSIEVITSVRFDGIQQEICGRKWRAFLLREIRSCVLQENIDIVYLIAHEDCRAYGGSAAFESARDEATLLHCDLWRARRIISDGLPDVYFGIKLLTAIKTGRDWRVYELKNEKIRAAETSVGFITETAKRRLKRRPVSA